MFAPAFALLASALLTAPQAGLALNEDNSHFFGSRDAAAMTMEGLHAFVDQYAGTKVTQLFLCPNSMKTSYDSGVWDAIWELGAQNPPQEEFAKKWVDNARILAEKNLDPYAIWIARCREKGISPWLSMRMNDVHNVDDEANYIHSSFWVAHPDYRRVPGGTGSWTDRAFNFLIKDVRDHHLNLIRELLERYDADGLELDWMRFGWHLPPGQEWRGVPLMTQFMRDVRALANAAAEKRGHPVKVGVRVPTLPGAARGLGMDAEAWVWEGLVDMLVPSPFWATADFDIPMEEWRERIGAAGCERITLAAGLEILLRGHPGGGAIENDIESVRGFAASQLHRGADQIYLFNYMDPGPMAGGVAAYRTLLEQGLSLDVITKLPRRHIVTYRDTVPPKMGNGALLPASCRNAQPFRIHIGPAPQSGRATFIMGLSDKGERLEVKDFHATLNGAVSTPEEYGEFQQFPGAVRAIAFNWNAAVLTDGYNEIKAGQEPHLAEQEIVWAELRINP